MGMKMNGAQIIIETLIEQGCDCVFGYPGGAVLNIYDELYKNRDRIRHIITAHEQGAAHAADGYARASGKVGVVIATSGPGATNLVTGIAGAYLDSTPLVAITGNVALPLLGRDSFQEVDITGITMPITKHNYIVKNVNELADIIREAFVIAKSGRPGPVLVDIPKDIQAGVAEYAPARAVSKSPYASPSEHDIIRAVEMIENAKKPYIYSGGGVVISDAGGEVKALAERSDAYIGFSMMGLSALPGDYWRCLGMTGMHGRYASTKANSEADLIIAVGVRFSDRATGNKARYSQNAKILHIDIDPAEIDKNIPVSMGLTGDIKETLSRILAKLDRQHHPEWADEVSGMIKEEISFYPSGKEFHPKNIIEKVQEYTSQSTVIATDVGQHQMWCAQYYKFRSPRTFLTSGGLGAMGFGMGAAIGGSIARGGARTVLFTGDGSFGMNLNELATAVTYKLPLVIIVMNNGVLGMVRQWQKLFYDKRFSCTTLGRKTDFVKLAEAFGAGGIRVCSTAELDAALARAFASDGPFVIDCGIDMDENVLPMIPPGGSIENIIVK
jgi:acetolactate synthase-1/2/3 large subunit